MNDTPAPPQRPQERRGGDQRLGEIVRIVELSRADHTTEFAALSGFCEFLVGPLRRDQLGRSEHSMIRERRLYAQKHG
jgi:hypothetical protein